MAKKKTTEKALNIDNILYNCRDYLRAARNSGSFFEKRDMMLTLVFLRFIGEKYEDGIENLKQTLKEQGLDPEDENIRAAFFDDATFADGTYNLPPEARWSTIISTPAPQLNVALDTALQRLEEEDPQLKGCFVKGTFTARNLAANDIKKIVDEVNKISHKTFGEEKDLIGRVYEYFLKEFAVNATKEEGEFYTPHDVVQLIAMMIEPYDGTLYDPCCGSGGMFIQSAELVKSKQGNLNGINVYGQEKEPATYRLAKMNLALRGISHNLGEEADSSFTHDLHKGLHFNYIMANPPFNLKGWYNDNLKNDGRWSDYQTPPDSNANYAWILHILSHLKKTDGVAGFLLANGALNDSDTLEIRKELIQNDKIEANDNVFRIKETAKKKILDTYLFMYLCRKEWDRYAEFISWGSSTEVFDWNIFCEEEIFLPPIQIQQKYVDVYNAMLENQKSYEHGLDDLKLSFEALLDEYKHKVEKMPIGSLLKEVDNRNMNGLIKNVQGINITKQFMPSVANTNGVDLSKYKVVNKGQFVFSGMQTGRDKCIRIALFDKVEPIIISPAYAVLEIIDADVLAEYVMMWFLRKEVDRLGWFMSDGSIRTNLDMDCFYEIEIPVPDINVQKSIVEIYNAYNVRRDINEKLKEQIKDICPILIKGSIEEARKAKEA